MPTAHVPALVGTDKKTGEKFHYGDYDVQLHECELCGGVYADSSEHGGTARHKAARLVAS